jgi:hypothetical protein
MVEGTVEGGKPAGCQHEFDEKELPRITGVGKVYTCIKCGAKVMQQKFWTPAVGKKVHRSKKERRRLRGV